MRYDHISMLPEQAFKPLGKRMTLEGGKGGSKSAPAPANQTVTQTNLPEYARPYFENLLNRSQALSYQEYQPYGAPRIAGFTPEQQNIQSQFSNLQTPGQFGESAQGMRGVGGLSMGAAMQGLGQSLNFRPQDTTAQNVQNQGLRNFQMGGPQNVSAMGVGTQNFGQDAANFYMNPFQQNVTDIALREARQQGQMQKQEGAMGAIGRGTFGGARQALMQSEGDRNLMRTMGDIQAQGSQQAFQNAQQQFQADQARQLQAQQANQQAGMQAQLANQQAGLTTGQSNLQAALGVQQLGSGQSLEAQKANQAAALQAAQMGQQDRQFGATLGSQLFSSGLSGAQQAASGLGALGSAEQTANLDRLGAQQSTASQQQALQQNQMDMAYQDFLRQRDFPQEQLGFYSNMLRGLPVQLASTQQTYQAAPNIGSQIAGAGLGLAGLSKAGLLG